MVRNYTLLLFIAQFILGILLPAASYAKPGNCDFTLNIEHVSCNGGSDGQITISSNFLAPPIFFQWSANVNNVVDSVAFNLEAGIYQLTIVDGGGCTSDTIIEILEPQPLTFATSAIRPIGSGSNGQINVAVSGGDGNYQYAWSNGVGTGNTAAGLPAGTYTVTVMDGRGCTAQTTIVLGNVPPITANIGGKDVYCFGQENGKAWVHPSGGHPPLSIQWITGSTNDTIFNLSPGIYGVTITDFYGFSVEDSIVIKQPLKLTVNLNKSDISCNGFSDGAIIASPGGGTNPYVSWNWFGPNGYTSGAGFGITGLEAGKYKLVLYDFKGCEVKDSVLIEEPQPIQISETVTATSAPGASDGEAFVQVSGGTPPYDYEWDVNGATVTDTIIDNVPAGQYPVRITDKNGCQKSIVVTIADGVVATPEAKVQFIYNAYPVGNPAFDIFIFDAQQDTLLKTFDSVSYLKASVFLDLPANVPLKIKTTAQQSPPDPAGAGTVLAMNALDENSKNIAIFNGNEPLNKLTADVYPEARLTSSIQDGQSFQLLLYHGSKDLGRANMFLESISTDGDVQNITYRDYAGNGYLTLDGTVDYSVAAKNFDNLLLGTIDIPISQLSLVGDAIVVIFTGVINGGYEEEFGIALVNPVDGSILRIAGDINVGIESFNNGESLVYPNPFNQQLQIKHSFVANDRIRLLDISGRQVLNQQVSNNANQMSLDLAYIPNGIYLLEIEQATGVYRTKVIKAD